MKKSFLAGFLFLMAAGAFAAERIEVSSGKILISDPLIGNMNETVYSVMFEPETSRYFLAFDKTDPRFIIELTEAQLKQLMKIFEKYLEWEAIAIKNQVEIDKPIPDGIIKTTVYWLYRDSWHISRDFDLRAQFLSRDKKTHHLKLSAQKVWSTTNRNIDFGMDFLFLDRDMAAAFNQGISEESIQRAKEEYKKQQEAGSLFN
jgi:hypothetical protein